MTTPAASRDESKQVADQGGELIDRLFDGGQQFGGVLGREADIVAAQAGHGGFGGGQRRAQVVTDRRQQRAAKFVGTGDGLGAACLLGEFALADQSGGLLGHRGEHPAVPGGQLAAGQQQPELVVTDLYRGVRAVDVAHGSWPTQETIPLLPSGSSRKQADGALRVGLPDPLQQCGQIGAAQDRPGEQGE